MLYALFLSIASAALGSKSFATTHPTSSNSCAYLNARNPVADMPSKIVNPRSGSFATSTVASSPSVVVATAAASASFIAPCSSAVRNNASRSASLVSAPTNTSSFAVMHAAPLARLFRFAVPFACSSARTRWYSRIIANDKSRFTTCGLL